MPDPKLGSLRRSGTFPPAAPPPTAPSVSEPVIQGATLQSSNGAVNPASIRSLMEQLKPRNQLVAEMESKTAKAHGRSRARAEKRMTENALRDLLNFTLPELIADFNSWSEYAMPGETYKEIFTLLHPQISYERIKEVFDHAGYILNMDAAPDQDPNNAKDQYQYIIWTTV